MEKRAGGNNVRNSLEKFPEIADHLRVYEQCRTVQLFSVEGTKGQGKQMVRVIKVVQMPTGYSILPWDGGLMDQPYRMWEFFEIFFNAERDVAFKKLNS